MAIEITDCYSFEGPYHLLGDLKNQAGVYVVLCIKDTGACFIVDAGESENVKKTIEIHERKRCWLDNCAGRIAVAVLYTPHLDRAGRTDIERIIRSREYVPCGKAPG